MKISDLTRSEKPELSNKIYPGKNFDKETLDRIEKWLAGFRVKLK